METLILQPHQSLPPHILIQLLNRVKQVLDHRVIDFVLESNKKQTNWSMIIKKGLVELLLLCVCQCHETIQQKNHIINRELNSRLSLFYK